MDTLDTAIAYGGSERSLGEIGVEDWHVVSKLPPLPASCPDPGAWAREQVIGAVQRLRIARLHGLMLHRSHDLLGAHAEPLYRALRELQSAGLVGKVGVSIYDPEELDELAPRFDLDIVQAPFNILDRRIAASGWLDRLHAAGTEIHVRSVFLQGLLLMSAPQRDPFFARWRGLWEQWDGWMKDNSITPLRACLGFVTAHRSVDRIVVGVDCCKQLQQIVTECGDAVAVPIPPLSTDDKDLINPSRWRLK
jgi:aryl-alcohol dehydrogenase-like predicted oxidoreductase